MDRESLRLIKKKWGEGTKYLTPAHHAFQVGKVQICFGNDKFFGLLFFKDYSRNRNLLYKSIKERYEKNQNLFKRVYGETHLPFSQIRSPLHCISYTHPAAAGS